MIHEQLLRTEFGGAIKEFPHLHLTITSMLRKNKMVISKVARTLAITKSQITHPVNQLVDVDIVVKKNYPV
jgi:predicted transcriptional regulator